MEKNQGLVIAEKLRAPLSRDVSAEMSARFRKGGYRQDGYGVSGGAAVDGSHALEGDQGYYTSDSRGSETGKKAFLNNVNAMREFFSRRSRRLGRPIRLVVKLGIGGQHTPFQGIADTFNRIDPQAGMIIGEYELGEDLDAVVTGILKDRGLQWDQVALVPSSKSGSTDETMMLFVQVFAAMIEHIACGRGVKESRRLAETVLGTLHELNFAGGQERAGAELFKVEKERFGTESLIELLAQRVSPLGIDRSQLTGILSVVLGNMFLETTDIPQQSRLSAFIRNSGLDRELGDDAPGFGAMFENVGGRWTGDLHMMTFLAFYGLDAEAYWQARREGIALVRAGRHPGNALGHKILDEGITDIALVVPDVLFWFGKSCEQNFNESIWQPGFANLIAVKAGCWRTQGRHYRDNPRALVINLSGLKIGKGFNVFAIEIPEIGKLDKQGLVELFAGLFTAFYGMTNTVGTRLIARAIRAAGRQAEEADLDNLDHPVTRIVQENLFLRQPYVELGKGLLETTLKELQLSCRRNPAAIRDALEDIKGKARRGELTSNIPGIERQDAGKTKALTGITVQACDFSRQSGRKPVIFVYLGGRDFRVLRDSLISRGIPWVMQGTGDQHISYQQVLAQPQKYLPLIVSFIPEHELSGYPAIGFAKGYLDNISPHMVRDYFAEASYRALTDLRREEGGAGLFLRLLESRGNIEMLKKALACFTRAC